MTSVGHQNPEVALRCPALRIWDQTWDPTQQLAKRPSSYSLWETWILHNKWPKDRVPIPSIRKIPKAFGVLFFFLKPGQERLSFLQHGEQFSLSQAFWIATGTA